MPPAPPNGKICYVEIPALDVPRSAEFYASVTGELLLLGCALAMGAGYWWMRHMSAVPRAPRLETRA